MGRWKGKERSEGKEGRRKKTHGQEKEMDERQREEGKMEGEVGRRIAENKEGRNGGREESRVI